MIPARRARKDAHGRDQGSGKGSKQRWRPLRGAPLRAWVADLAAPRTATDGTPLAEVAPIALRMLDVADDAEVELRAVHTGVLTAE